MQLCFFSDELADNFLPLTLTRPLSELRVGILTLREKWERSLNTSFTTGIFEPHLLPLFGYNQELNEEDCIWINSRYLPTQDMVDNLLSFPKNSFLKSGKTVIAVRISSSDSKIVLNNGSINTSELEQIEAKFNTNSIIYLWDLLKKNGEEIKADIERLGTKPLVDEVLFPKSIFTCSEQIFVEDGATIEPGCILMADKGPIYIGENSIVEAGSILKGPVAVCEGATVKMGARIYDGTTIGPVSKVGGEVAGTIFHSYSNKGHDGYVGNSLIGQWCNLGADTNTSNLKNNYGKVKLLNWKTKEPYQEGLQFLGSVVGDHSKTSINSMLNTGTVCGVSSNIFSSDFPPKYIPSFKWVGDGDIQTYRFEKAIEVMEAMMKRRNVDLHENYRRMMEFLFENKDA